MKTLKELTSALFLLLLTTGTALSASAALPNLGDTVLEHFSVTQCDSLIQANADNPNFVILDVRDLNDYNAQHLIGAIERDYWNGNFNTWIDQLPRNKFYLVHCASGGRSGNTFTLMEGMNFTKVVNMLGGINAWNGAALPTTVNFAPLQMAVSDTMVLMDTIEVGTEDTITLTVTNRANDTLRFLAITSLAGTEFNTDFDTTTTLLGPFDYTFSIFYNPLDTISDSLSFLIESNGGDVEFRIWRTGKVVPLGIAEISKGELKLYPNPTEEKFRVTSLEFGVETVEIYDLFGRKVLESTGTVVDMRGYPKGVYFVRLGEAVKKLILR